MDSLVALHSNSFALRLTKPSPHSESRLQRAKPPEFTLRKLFCKMVGSTSPRSPAPSPRSFCHFLAKQQESTDSEPVTVRESFVSQ